MTGASKNFTTSNACPGSYHRQGQRTLSREEREVLRFYDPDEIDFLAFPDKPLPTSPRVREAIERIRAWGEASGADLSAEIAELENALALEREVVWGHGYSTCHDERADTIWRMMCRLERLGVNTDAYC